MIKRTILIESEGATIRTELQSLVVSQSDRETARVPLEDLGLLILESPQILITQSALAACAENGAAVLVCARNHLPVGLMLPLAGNTLHTQRLRAQVETKKPLKKQLWRQIIKVKIANQAALLPKNSRARKKINALTGQVKSGDSDNREAVASRLYWRALFDDSDFRRDRYGEAPNNLLNYGYMILRATAARALCGAGLHPALGLHHSNRENPFCLADDILEPYRPFVDRRVLELHRANVEKLDKNAKASLLKILADTIKLGKDKAPLMVAMQKSASSLANCYADKNGKLHLPTL